MDIFKFPLLAEVWGTVSDWVMIAVTSVTAYFLWKTLKSQKEVQQAQNKLLEIEQLRVREDYKPVVKYKYFEDNTILKNLSKPLENDEQIVSIALFYNSHRGLKVKVTFEESSEVLQMIQMINPSNSEDDYKASVHFITKNFHVRPLSYFINFECQYQDVAGTIYKQTVLCYKYIGADVNLRPFLVTVVNS
jgi:hypothetical protein